MFKQLMLDFGEGEQCVAAVSTKNETLCVPTAILGELPNDCGVYVCPPDEVIEWRLKRDYVIINLLRLKNGKQLFSFHINIGTSGISTPLSLSDYSSDNREDVLKIVQNSLRGCFILDEKLPAPLRKSLEKFIDELV